ncbi:hypothetical protein SNEBB_006844 [Seison nebaliae]|nr:hypothetical protein SNEBB_006844 [Seison nebaliae]
MLHSDDESYLEYETASSTAGSLLNDNNYENYQDEEFKEINYISNDQLDNRVDQDENKIENSHYNYQDNGKSQYDEYNYDMHLNQFKRWSDLEEELNNERRNPSEDADYGNFNKEMSSKMNCSNFKKVEHLDDEVKRFKKISIDGTEVEEEVDEVSSSFSSPINTRPFHRDKPTPEPKSNDIDEKKFNEFHKTFYKKKKNEENISLEELKERFVKSKELKEEGNFEFSKSNFREAIICYTRALYNCPSEKTDFISILLQNRATCFLHQNTDEQAIQDLNTAINFNKRYVKAYMKRAKLLEKLNKLEGALEDYQTVKEIDKNIPEVYYQIMRLDELIKTNNEKLKTEMFGKLKLLANDCLGRFGLSTDNFQYEKDPQTGNYSINMQH